METQQDRLRRIGDKVAGSEGSPQLRPLRPSTKEGRERAEAVSAARARAAYDDRRQPLPADAIERVRLAWLAEQSPSTQARVEARRRRVTGSAAALSAAVRAIAVGVKGAAAADLASEAAQLARDKVKLANDKCPPLSSGNRLSGKPRVRSSRH